MELTTESSQVSQSTSMSSASNQEIDFGPSDKLTGAIKSKSRTRRHKSKEGGKQVCGICGDSALGYNFDAITCESCKAFFRRNAHRSKEIKCSFDSRCKLDPHTRKFCSSCRLNKCLSVGMKKDWILTDEELAKRREKRILKATTNSPRPEVWESPSSSTRLSPGPLADSPSSLYILQPHSQASTPNSPGLETSDPDSTMTQDPTVSKQESLLHSLPSVIKQESLLHSLPTSRHTFHPTTCITRSTERTILCNDQPFVNMEEKHSTTTLGISESRRMESNTDDELSPPNEYISLVPVSLAHNFHINLEEKEETCLQSSSQPFDLLNRNYELKERDKATANTCESAATLGEGVVDVDAVMVSSKVVSPTPAIYDTNFQMYPQLGSAKKVPLTKEHNDSIILIEKAYHSVFDAPYNIAETKNITPKPTSATEMFNMTDAFIRRLIKFAKTIPEFKALNQEDQISLLKGSVMAVMILRGAHKFDCKVNGWEYKDFAGPHTLSSSQILAPQPTLFKTMRDFAMSLSRLTRGDMKIIILLYVLELFSPDRALLNEKPLVFQAQDKYSALLQAYLSSCYSQFEASVLYPKILMLLVDLRTLAARNEQNAAQVDLSKMEPLLLEIFNLHC